MEVETQETEEGYEIRIKTDQKIALSIKTESGEKIYLPGVESDESSYYVEDPLHLKKTSNGYYVRHRGKIEKMEIIS